MEIQARVALSLPNKFYKVELKYDTFEKATFDSYLIASVIKNAKNEKAALKYIDEITGKGSLNPHFKKLYEEISQMTSDQIDGILNDSLYPITVVDRKNHFKYYEMFNATRMNDNVYPGNLADKDNLYEMLMPKDEQAKFLSIDFETEDGTIKKDMYNAIFTDKEIKVDLDGGKYYKISKDDFLKVFDHDEVDPSVLPHIGTTITPGNWSVVTNDVVDAWNKGAGFKYKNRDGNNVVLSSDFIKITEVINVFDLYFYKETKYEFTKENVNHVKEALVYLKDSKNLNNFKTKSLIMMMSVIEDIHAQQFIQFVLTRKNSKDIAEFGLKLIKNGLEKGWEDTPLNAIKEITPPNDIQYIYRINHDLTYNVSDYLNIPDKDLVEIHLMQKKAFLQQKDEMIKNIRLWVGEMLEIREKAKKLQKNSVTKAFNDFANEYIGHLKKDYTSMPFETLKKEFEYIQNMYNGNYQKVKASLEKAED